MTEPRPAKHTYYVFSAALAGLLHFVAAMKTTHQHGNWRSSGTSSTVTTYENMSLQSSGHGQGDCVDSNGNYYDSWYTNGLNYTQCTAYCTADSLCLGVTHRASDGNCELRFSEGTLPTDSPSSSENCPTTTYSYTLVYNDTWCASSSPLSNSMSTDDNQSACEATCNANEVCQFLMYGHNTVDNKYHCATFQDCDATAHYSYDDGDPNVYNKVTSASTEPTCPIWTQWTEGTASGEIHRVQGKACHVRDRQYSYSLLYNDTWCGDEPALRDETAHSGNQSDCAAWCDADPECKFYVFGHDTSNQNYRCSTFSSCDKQYQYGTGDPNVYKKTNMTSQSYEDITPYGTDAGCVDSQDRHFDALWKQNTNFSDCQAECDKLEDCLGLDVVTSTGYCELEFNDGKLPASVPEGFTAWANGTATGGIAKVHDGEGRICYKKQVGTASATGDPHLTNVQGHKFDIHDGKHRLVHYPRGAPDSEALLMIDVDAEILPGKTSCYNVFLQAAKISGRWVGDDISLQHDKNPVGQATFYLTVSGRSYAWPTLAKDAASLKLSGTVPLKLLSRTRMAEEDTPGGDELEFSIGQERPVVVEVWASHGSNELTDGADVQYLNLAVKNLPQDAGGLLGLDQYTTPPGAKCGLTNAESGPFNSIDDLVMFHETRANSMFQWQASA